MGVTAETDRSADAGRPPSGGGSQARRIASWLEPQEILFDAPLRDRRHALELASEAIARAHHLNAAPVERALWRRELVGSTALGKGIAIPHARIEGIDRPLTIFIRSRPAIDFAAPDGQAVADILVLLVPSDGDPDDHLQLLALIAQMFCDDAFRGRLAGATDAASARSAFADYARNS
jgi:nitrogen PTS system EIIA component